RVVHMGLVSIREEEHLFVGKPQGRDERQELLRPDLVDAQLVDHEARLSTSLVGQRRPARESRLLLVQLEPVLPRARTEDRTAAAPNRRLGVTRASVAGALLPV